MPAYLRHVVLNVTSIERSLPFYRGLLEPLGWTELTEYVGERGQPTWSLWGPGGAEMPSLQLRERLSEGHAPHDRFAVGVHHVAFDAPSREAVDDRAHWLREVGATIESGPEAYDRYAPGYYAVFFYDPDGLKLEVVHKPVHRG
jgi:catechol 2,3-dioxygenase-like lactoylglutathione lyase family enzyme